MRAHHERAVPSPVRVMPLDRQAFERFRLPRRMGEAISGWDQPAFAAATEAGHMRPDDYVIGVINGGEARAYPLWIIDNYHIVNDRFGADRVVVASCERCQSGSAFLAEVPG